MNCLLKRILCCVILPFLIKADAGAQPAVYDKLTEADTCKSFMNLGYDNDYFTATDYYYTQGIHFEYINPAVKKISPAGLVFKHLKNETINGVGLQHLAYTPLSIRHVEILCQDRPFAACLLLQNFSVYADAIKHYRMLSTINLGILGDWAGGAWMQKTIHRNLHNIAPLGWNNQVRNEAVINYDFSFEKLLFGHSNLFCLTAFGSASVGTLHDKVSAGTPVMIGNFTNPFISHLTPGRKFHVSFVIKPFLNFVVYDATLQGGLFNHTSPYTLPDKEITRITFETEGEITLGFEKIYIEYHQHFITKEFTTGKYHRWGGLRIYVCI